MKPDGSLKNEYLIKAVYCLKTFKWLLTAFKIKHQLFSETYFLTFHDFGSHPFLTSANCMILNLGFFFYKMRLLIVLPSTWQD